MNDKSREPEIDMLTTSLQERGSFVIPITSQCPEGLARSMAARVCANIGYTLDDGKIVVAGTRSLGTLKFSLNKTDRG